MDLAYIKANYSKDYTCECGIAYYWLTNVIANSTKLSKSDKATLMGMLPGGANTDYMTPFQSFVDVAYQTAYFGKISPLGSCSNLGWTDPFTSTQDGTYYGRECTGSPPHLICKEVADGTIQEHWMSVFNVKDGDGQEIISEVIGSPGNFDLYLRTEIGQDFIKRLTQDFINYTISEVIGDIAHLVILAVLIGLINGAEAWLDSLGLPGWLLQPILALLGIGQQAIQTQMNLTEADLQQITNVVASQNQLLGNLMSDGIQSLEGNLNTIESSVSNTVETELNKITPLIQGVQTYISNLITSTTTKIEGTLDTSLNQLSAQVTGGNKEVQSQLDTLVNGTINMNLSELLGG